MDPCVTPNSRYLGDNIVLPMITLWERPCKYDENHCRAVPEKPKYDPGLSTRECGLVYGTPQTDQALQVRLRGFSKCHQ